MYFPIEAKKGIRKWENNENKPTTWLSVPSIPNSIQVSLQYIPPQRYPTSSPSIYITEPWWRTQASDATKVIPGNVTSISLSISFPLRLCRSSRNLASSTLTEAPWKYRHAAVQSCRGQAGVQEGPACMVTTNTHMQTHKHTSTINHDLVL